MGVAPGTLVNTTPFETGWGQLVGSQRAGSWSEAAGQNNAFLAVPLLIVLENPCMSRHILHKIQKKRKRKIAFPHPMHNLANISLKATKNQPVEIAVEARWAAYASIPVVLGPLERRARVEPTVDAPAGESPIAVA